MICLFFSLLLSVVSIFSHATPPLTYGIPNIYAPWRSSYHATFISNEERPQAEKECPFCFQMSAKQDTDYFILYRGTHNCIMMNAFPYSKGHLLIIPYKHAESLEKISKETRAEMMELAMQASITVKQALQCKGFNVGFNIGPVSGASILDHIHMHIVPRFSECYSFMHTIGQTSVIGFNLTEVYQQLLPLFSHR